MKKSNPVHVILETLAPEKFKSTRFGELEQHPYLAKQGFSKNKDGSLQVGRGFDRKTITHEMNKEGQHHVQIWRNLDRHELAGEGVSNHSPGMALDHALNRMRP